MRVGIGHDTHRLVEGRHSLNTVRIGESGDRLGAAIITNAALDRTAVSLAALRSNLAPSLDLMADIIKTPAFAPGEIERERGERLAQIAAEMSRPQSIALRTLPPLLFGAGHPYGIPFTGSGTAEAVRAITRDDILAAHDAWIRPDTARIFVVGDTTLAQIVPMLEARFGSWHAPASARGTKSFSAAIPDARARIILIDRPQSPQSLILGGLVLPVSGTDDLDTLLQANDVLGGSFLSRLNMDLRETKHWAYGVGGQVNRVEHTCPSCSPGPASYRRSIAERAPRCRTPVQLSHRPSPRRSPTPEPELPGSFETRSGAWRAQSNAPSTGPDDCFDASPAALADDRGRARRRRAVDRPRQSDLVVVGDARGYAPSLSSSACRSRSSRGALIGQALFGG